MTHKAAHYKSSTRTFICMVRKEMFILTPATVFCISIFKQCEINTFAYLKTNANKITFILH